MICGHVIIPESNRIVMNRYGLPVQRGLRQKLPNLRAWVSLPAVSIVITVKVESVQVQEFLGFGQNLAHEK